MKKQPLTVEPGKEIHLAEFDAAYHAGLDKADAERMTHEHVLAIAPLAARLYAEDRRALLIILQGIDASGKDGTIRHVMHGVNPQSCQITPFKAPSEDELQHDYLWRIHNAVPRKGNIGIFNRSQYEDIVTVRVRKLAPEEVWSRRYDHINHFERLLADEYLTIIKIFLHISKGEQRKRLQKRLDNPDKRWKFRLGDLDDRKLWDEYQEAYSDALTKCNTQHAPWYIVPADRKWYRNLVIGQLVRETLEKMNPRFPEATENLEGIVVE